MQPFPLKVLKALLNFIHYGKMRDKRFWYKILVCAGYLKDFCNYYDCIVCPNLTFFRDFGALVMLKQWIPLYAMLNNANIMERKVSNYVRAKLPALSLHTFTAELCYQCSSLLIITKYIFWQGLCCTKCWGWNGPLLFGKTAEIPLRTKTTCIFRSMIFLCHPHYSVYLLFPAEFLYCHFE